jgi:mannose-6-phosphate isomerase
VELLENPIQPYAWGSTTALAEFLGKPPSAAPEAELWIGAHPLASSLVLRPNEKRSLAELIATAPEKMVGKDVVEHFGAQLPFLLKVLAAAQPLSLQAHPSIDQARAGYARENAANIPLSAAHRNYKDANHKPELISALTPFDALCGFREVARSVELFDGLGIERLRQLERVGLCSFFTRLLELEPAERQALAVQTAQACAARPPPSFAHECAWAVRIAQLYPGDVGIVGALLLNLIRLQPGEALFLPAGNLHAYLQGTGIEIMANSDNVLRGGLTQKHVDAIELLRVLDFRAGPCVVLRARGTVERGYDTPAREFRLSILSVAGSFRVERAIRGPELLLVTDGDVTVTTTHSLRLRRGQSAFIRADEADLTFVGTGTVFRATVGR